MTLAEQLREYNDWRRGGDFSQPNPRDLGVLIDKSADRLEAAEKLIEQLESALSGVMRFTIGGTVECRGDKCRERWCLSCNNEEDANEAVAEAYNSFAVVNEALAAAKQWKDGV